MKYNLEFYFVKLNEHLSATDCFYFGDTSGIAKIIVVHIVTTVTTSYYVSLSLVANNYIIRDG